MRIILIISFMFLFTGCVKKVYIPVEKVKKVYVPMVETKYKSLPSKLLEDDVYVPSPPDKVKYLNANSNIRNRMLTKTVIDLYSSIKLYKVKLKVIRYFDSKLKGKD